ncbi:serine hydrolase [Jiangella asiatica]|uniref:Serine hydrolase n=1 Tax=Jiangella asiatica TaxID=2530372 RepID=A0A4R5DIS6_9ACTN|nr:serine hydrolase [Jiangella asiatica]TDE13996.1 serine hydrolase [Jiangella asiatica]
MSHVMKEIAAVLGRAGTSAALHARPVDGPGEVALNADSVSVAASTYKISVLLELACQAAEGTLSLTSRLRVPADRRSLGPTGISAMLDDVELSLRDLALLMMQISDNTATDVVQELVGTDRIAARLAALGLTGTSFPHDCARLVGDVLDDLGAYPDELSRDELRRALDASPSIAGTTGNITTPRDMTTLVSAIWRDEAGPAQACEEVRRVMLQQYAPHRLSTAYRDGPVIAGKTGTFHGGIRNEVGVVDFGGGERYAVAVYLRQHEYDVRDGRADAAIGEVARLAIDHLRGAA